MIQKLKAMLITAKATPDFIVTRLIQTPVGTFGEMHTRDGVLVCYTMERPWVDADQNGKRDTGKSRFVAGLYKMYLRLSKLNGGTGKRSYNVWEFLGIPDIVAAQIHIANTPDQLEGCIGLGMEYTFAKKVPVGVGRSKEAHDKFMALTKGKKNIWVEVIDKFQAVAKAA